MRDYMETPLWNNSLADDERIDYLLRELTLDEKFKCMGCGTPEIPRLGLWRFGVGGEAAHGIEARHDQWNIGDPEFTTQFTQPIGMSATWDPEVIKKAGETVGIEARVLYHRNPTGGLSRWAPTIDMERDPRWGRNEEAYGEDPMLTGEMCSAYINGLQGEHPKYLRVGVTLKHFFANNVEEGRVYKSSNITPRDMYEYYLEPFRRAIEKGHAESVMTSYNQVNGIPMMVNPIVRDVLKKQFGLPGHVICDGGAMQQVVDYHHYTGTHAETVALSLKAGVDGMTDDDRVVEASAREAYELGLISESDMDTAIRNKFRTRIKLGIYDKNPGNPFDNVTEENVNSKANKKICLDVANEAMVLLKNQNNLLPFNEKDDVCVIGPLSNQWNLDWYCGEPPYQINPLDGINKLIGHNAEFENGLDSIEMYMCKKPLVLDGENTLVVGEKTQNAEKFVFEDWGCGKVTLFSERLGMYLSLHDDGRIVADKKRLLTWNIKEQFSFKKNEAKWMMFSWNGERVIIDGNPAAVEIKTVKDGIARAAELAAKHDKVIVILGCHPMINSKEEIDRTTIELPEMQKKLMKQIVSVNKNAVMFLLSNYPYSICEEQENVKAILWSATGSQEMGNAVANTIFGKNNPAGRLNMTWYSGDHQLTNIDDYDIIKNKRTYRYFDEKVLYPFGHGLTYSEFEYANIDAKIVDCEKIIVTVEVTNTGDITSDEVVQVYGSAPKSRAIKPIKQLIGFERIHDVKPGETRHVCIETSVSEFRFFNVVDGTMIVESGEYTIEAGASSSDIRQKSTIHIWGSQTGSRNPFVITPANRFDDYENMIMINENHGYDCLKASDDSHSWEAEYRDFKFDREAKALIVNMKCDGDGCLDIYADGEKQSEWTKVACDYHTDRYRNISFEINKKNLTELRFVANGAVRISRFWFE